MLLLLTACTEYELSKGAGATGPRQRDRDSAQLDSAADTNGEGGADTDPPDTAPPDTAPPDGGDGCYEPEDGYSQNPAARLYVTDAASPVVVTFLSTSTAYSDELVLDAPEAVTLARNWSDAVGQVSTLGPYGIDAELIFALNVQNTGEHWQSGPGDRNSDGVVHVAATFEGDCSWLIGFEDMTGGGDLDYNDVVLRVQGYLRQDR